MYMDRFYPPGREKIHGQGALDLALWDIKGKALQLPLYDLLHGTIRSHVECYATTFRPAGAAPPGRGAGPAAAQAQPGAGRGGGGGGNSGDGAARARTSRDGGRVSVFQGRRRHRRCDPQ